MTNSFIFFCAMGLLAVFVVGIDVYTVVHQKNLIKEVCDDYLTKDEYQVVYDHSFFRWDNDAFCWNTARVIHLALDKNAGVVPMYWNNWTINNTAESIVNWSET